MKVTKRHSNKLFLKGADLKLKSLCLVKGLLDLLLSETLLTVVLTALRLITFNLIFRLNWNGKPIVSEFLCLLTPSMSSALVASVNLVNALQAITQPDGNIKTSFKAACGICYSLRSLASELQKTLNALDIEQRFHTPYTAALYIEDTVCYLK